MAQHDAFAFFLSRCKQDQEVCEMLQHAAEHKEDVSSEMRKRGAIVLDILLKLEKGKDPRLNLKESPGKNMGSGYNMMHFECI